MFYMTMLNPYLLIELVVDDIEFHILMSNFVVDNVVQLIVVLLLNVTVEFRYAELL